MNEQIRLVILEQKSRQSTTCLTGQPDYCERTTRFRTEFFFRNENRKNRRMCVSAFMSVQLCVRALDRSLTRLCVLAAMLHLLEKCGIIPYIWWYNSNIWSSISFIQTFQMMNCSCLIDLCASHIYFCLHTFELNDFARHDTQQQCVQSIIIVIRPQALIYSCISLSLIYIITSIIVIVVATYVFIVQQSVLTFRFFHLAHIDAYHM